MLSEKSVFVLKNPFFLDNICKYGCVLVVEIKGPVNPSGDYSDFGLWL